METPGHGGDHEIHALYITSSLLMANDCSTTIRDHSAAMTIGPLEFAHPEANVPHMTDDFSYIRTGNAGMPPGNTLPVFVTCRETSTDSSARTSPPASLPHSRLQNPRRRASCASIRSETRTAPP